MGKDDKGMTRRTKLFLRTAIMGIAMLMLTAVVQVNADRQSALTGLETYLAVMFPEATRFTENTGDSPHIQAFRITNDSEELLGFAFLTLDIEPLERGYEGPIEMLVGLDVNGKLTGVEIIKHREPYGYFSIDLPEFTEQFLNKSILDRFRVGEDIDGITTATITVSSATRAIRKSARRIASAFLAETNGDAH